MDPEQSSAGLADRGAATEAARVGVISDTHGLLRPEVFDAFEGVARILHAGDVGDPAILADLGSIAPVTAVWGNVDRFDVRERAAETASGTIGGLRWAMAHGHREQPAYERLVERFPEAGLVVHGHSHVPALSRVGSTLLLNPGAAGPKRLDLPASVALVELEDRGPPRIWHLDLETGDGFRA